MTKTTQLIPVVGTGAAAAMIFNILPVFIGQAVESFGLDDSAAGWLGDDLSRGVLASRRLLRRSGSTGSGRGRSVGGCSLLPQCC